MIENTDGVIHFAFRRTSLAVIGTGAVSYRVHFAFDYSL